MHETYPEPGYPELNTTQAYLFKKLMSADYGNAKAGGAT